jgi:hypothetical protein
MLIETLALRTRCHHSIVQHNYPPSFCRVVHVRDKREPMSIYSQALGPYRPLSLAAESLALRLRLATHHNNIRESYKTIGAGKASSLCVAGRLTFIL